MKKWLSEIRLEGKRVALIPLHTSHKNDLIAAAADGFLWNLWFTSVPSEDTIENYIDHALHEYEKDRALPFVVVDKQKHRVVGSTRLMNGVSKHKRIEIGHTWYAKSSQKTGINTECKYLLLRYAFEQLECIAVEFNTHWHNMESRAAILRLGAKQDGVLRNHRIDSYGNYRDTVVFSIVKHEWNTVKASLEFKMNRRPNA